MNSLSVVFIIAGLAFFVMGLKPLISKKHFEKIQKDWGKESKLMPKEELYKYNKYWRTTELILFGIIFIVFGLLFM